MLSWYGQPVRFLRGHPYFTLSGLLLGLLLGGAGYLGSRQLRAWQHCRAAEEALHRRDFHQARVEIEACLQLWPHSVRAHHVALQTARRSGDLDEAERELATCQELEQSLTDETTLEWALIQTQRGRLPQVEDYLRTRLTEDHPKNPLILEVLTSELMRTRRLLEAQRYLDQWLRLQPRTHDAMVRRGWVAEHLFDFPSAIRNYEEALALTPADDPVRQRLAELLEKSGQAGQAADQFENLRQRQPGNPAALLGLAHYHLCSGRTREAQELLDVLLAAHPEHAQALGERGQMLLTNGQTSEALTSLRKAADLAPHDQQILYSLYQCLERLGKKDEARQCFAQLQRIKADQKRMDYLMRQIQERPADADLRHEVGTIFLRNGLEEDGLGWLSAALEANPGHRAAHEALAGYYQQHGKPDLARAHRRAVEQLSGTAAPEGEQP